MSRIEVDSPFDELFARHSGAVVTRSHPDWNTVRLAWNRAVDQQPHAIVIPKHVEDVIAAIRYASAHSLRITAQATGHQAMVLGDISDTILVNTSALTGIEIDPSARSVRVCSGMTWNDIVPELAEHGLAALTGSAGDIGAVGFMLGGGFSWFSRELGLASSTLLAIEIVTSDGKLRRVDTQNEPELFWALRGGGGNFGVVTAIEFSVFPIEDVYVGTLFYPLKRANEVLEAFEQSATMLDERATLCARIIHLPPMPDLPEFLRGKSFAAIDGALNAPTDEALKILQPFIKLGPIINSFERISPAALSHIHMDPPNPVPGVSDGVVLDDLPVEAISALIARVGHGADTPLLVVDLRMLGGALSRPANNGGAINHLSGRFLLNTVGIAATPGAAAMVREAVMGVLDAIGPWRSAHDYSNFCESPTTPEALFDEETLARLRAVKAQYDPEGTMRGCHQLT